MGRFDCILIVISDRFTEEFHLSKLVHMVNSEGFQIAEDDQSIASLGMACNSVLTRYPFVSYFITQNNWGPLLEILIT